MNQYLVASEFIDFDHHLVARKAKKLADGAIDQHDLIKAVFILSVIRSSIASISE